MGELCNPGYSKIVNVPPLPTKCSVPLPSTKYAMLLNQRSKMCFRYGPATTGPIPKASPRSLKTPIPDTYTRILIPCAMASAGTWPTRGLRSDTQGITSC